MEIYPLICWQLSKDSICARLVGTDYEMVHSQLQKLITHFAEHLQREYIKADYLPEPLLAARLKKVNVKIRPSRKIGFIEKYEITGGLGKGGIDY